jgi:hypothetical protein
MSHKALTAAVLLACCSSSIAAEKGGEVILSQEVIVERSAQQVYVGTDRDMPLNGRYLLAIQPERTPSGDVVPSSIVQALRAMHRALPRWYVAAVKANSGNDECGVVVNNVGYGHSVAAWMWLNWVKPDSPLWNEFEALGARVRNSASIRNALSIGLCDLIKTDDERIAMEQVAFQAKFELVQ